jgi:hypothetical protein
LYSIFEQHLYNALVENESTEDFLIRVVNDYISVLRSSGQTIMFDQITEIQTDLREEVLEMLRKKIYGHYNLADFRKAHMNGKLGSSSNCSEISSANCDSSAAQNALLVRQRSFRHRRES